MSVETIEKDAQGGRSEEKGRTSANYGDTQVLVCIFASHMCAIYGWRRRGRWSIHVGPNCLNVLGEWSAGYLVVGDDNGGDAGSYVQ